MELARSGGGDAREAAAAAIYNLAAHDGWVRTRIVQAGAIKPLVALLGGSVMAQHRAAAALGTLGAGKAAHQARIVKAANPNPNPEPNPNPNQPGTHRQGG